MKRSHLLKAELIKIPALVSEAIASLESDPDRVTDIVFEDINSHLEECQKLIMRDRMSVKDNDIIRKMISDDTETLSQDNCLM